jgi:hypothetical protein
VLAAVDDVGYREVLEEVLECGRGLQLSFEAGAVGFSIRVAVPDRSEPVSLGWLFPPGVSGWMGLTEFNLGCDGNTVGKLSVAPHFMAYAERLRQIAGVEEAHVSGLEAVWIHQRC